MEPFFCSRFSGSSYCCHKRQLVYRLVSTPGPGTCGQAAEAASGKGGKGKAEGRSESGQRASQGGGEEEERRGERVEGEREERKERKRRKGKSREAESEGGETQGEAGSIRVSALVFAGKSV